MNAKTTNVALKCEALGVREFEITHAERLLAMNPNGGWQLAEDNYELKDGNIVRRNKGTAKQAPQGGGNK